MSLAVGVVLSRVLESHGVAPLLKWPNDVLLETSSGAFGKLAGILVEMSGDAAGPCEVVVGIGINVDLSAEFRAGIEQPVSAVRDQAPALARNQLAIELLAQLMPLLADFEQHGFAAWQDAWNARHAFAGQEVEVIQGDRRDVAIAEQVDASGNLWVRRSTERWKLAGGEISVRGRV